MSDKKDKISQSSRKSEMFSLLPYCVVSFETSDGTETEAFVMTGSVTKASALIERMGGNVLGVIRKQAFFVGIHDKREEQAAKRRIDA